MPIRSGRVGRAGMRRRDEDRQRAREAGEEELRKKMESMEALMGSLREGLRRYAEENRDVINKDPAFRRDFQRMCDAANVDPLASSKGFWGQLLGVGDFYFELGVQLLDVCLSTRPLNGGVMTLDELRRRVSALRGAGVRRWKDTEHKGAAVGGGGKEGVREGRNGGRGETVTDDDIERAIRKLHSLGNGIRLENLDGTMYVLSVPGELSPDESMVFGSAQRHKGSITASELATSRKWLPERAQRALEKLVAEGIAWVDITEKEKETRYWFPSLFNE